MVIGEYPCCGESLMIGVPEVTPAYCSEECEHCGEVVWHRLSRVDPMSWGEADFLATHDFDHDAMTITPKEGGAA